MQPRRARPAFSLVELLVVIAIIALLVGLALPALSAARKGARSTACLAALHGCGVAHATYSTDHKDYVIPSYTMTGTSGLGVPLDGWGPLLERDGYLSGAGGDHLRNSPLTCPDAKDVDGLLAGQTGNDPDNPRGWMQWPTMRTGAGFTPQTIDDRNLDKILKVAYWINADNPIGGVAEVTPDLYYSGSVGYGPSSNGLTIGYSRTSAFVRPSTLVALADGVYAGRQRNNRLGSTNSRIGYRHPGGKGAANAAFADGHAAPIEGTRFPRALNTDAKLDQLRAENWSGQPTVYANPERALRD